MYLLDTNICIYTIKQRSTTFIDKFKAAKLQGRVGISAITYAELQYGIQKSQRRSENQVALAQFLVPLKTFEFDEKAGILFGEIKTALEKMGTPIGSYDMLIAAHALSLDATLITNNEGEFRRVPGLKVENWL
ncbi:type II toxin-antitoxin system tRNA(fMet)-specific endonuclease VapC [Turneriella parva]|uniref:Ribonuclease VapC n=1 Tax=Turneriella parva (strain ATCC BAA-1111 / DSM 21527 / NCTC 11395 / H) TaxID=869212 RepID=I4B4A1_TURPD|nr:PIN domain-containing protein [Turneriella parva]AFM12108.1 PilT protein domain protein [Turneriella parva DSM 21527]